MKRLFLVVLLLAIGAFAQNGGPTVSITAPASGATFVALASISISAAASEPSGVNASITQVQFFAGSTLIGTARTSPYTFVWSNVTAGSYSLTATATDSAGLSATSSAVSITVNSGTSDFTIGVSPASLSLSQGGSNNATVTVASVNGFNSATSLSASGLPSGVNAAFFSPSITPAPGGSATSTMALSATSSATTGISTISITGTSGSITHSATLSLTVTAVNPPNYVGYVDHMGCDSIAGWAADRNRLNTSINVEIYDGTTLIQTVLANVSRPDVGSFLGDNGLHGYSIATPSRFKDGLAHQVHVKFETSTTELTNSPQSLTCSTGSGTIQGYKIASNGTVFNSPGATITIDGGAQSFGPTVNPYTPSVTAGSHTVTSSTPAGFSVSYSMCVNCTDHTAAGGHPFVSGTSVTVNVSSGGYVDLWWMYTAASQDVPPVASISSPSSGATFTAPASITIQAAASDSDGTVSKVDFYASGLLIGTVTAPPYNFTWTNVPAGNYTLTAVATDNAGLTGSSAPVAIGVSSTSADFSTPRVDPSNRTGLPGEDLLSGNYNWSLPLVSLKGRAGLDLGLTLTYNSLIWTKSGSSIEFDADHGFPGPGFRLGFPSIQPKYFDSIVGVNAYLLIMPSGQRIEVRQVGTSNIYDSGDSSYVQVVDNGPSGLLARTPNGTQLTYQLIASEYRCTQVKDRNGNFITVNYNSFGHISSLMDTLGRTITFNYDSSQLNLLQSITQTWNGSQHIWASFTYGTLTLQTNFTGLTLVGVQSGQSVTVPTQVTLADGSYFTFQYTTWGQVSKITRSAADTHELAHVTYDLPLNASVAQSDCPRFTQRRNLAENWNGGAEAITSFVFDPVNLTGGQMTTPDGTVHKETYGTSTWQRGLTTQTQIISGGVVKKTTAVSYIQDNTSLGYVLNPRPTEVNITDDLGNHRRTTTVYNTFALPDATNCSFPSDVSEYAADATTVLRRIHTEYNLAAAYLSAHILGLPATVSVFDGNGALASEIGYQYDAGVQDQGATVQHDEANFGAGFIQGRSNLTGVQRFNVLNTGQSLVSTIGYNTDGSVISTMDPAGHQITINYADSFSVGTPSGQTLAYPTSLTDPDGFIWTTQYNYDTGAATLTQDPKGAQQKYLYDALGRLLQQTYHDSVNNTDGTSTSYSYSSSMNQMQTSTLLDPGLVSTSTQFLDGAGRVRQTLRNFPGSTGGFSTVQMVYDVMGRPVQQSNPTETDANGTPAGDDATGFISSLQQYDWTGRPTLHTNQDGTMSQVAYSGCGCAGGLIETKIDEIGRSTRVTHDILGRPVKAEILNFDGTVYKTAVTTFSVLDQVTNITEQQGSSGTSQTTIRTYDGFGRLATEHRPEQDPGASTVYIYYSDDTIQSVTDGRGAAKNFTYNNRGLPTRITYTKPDGHTAPLEIDLSYDGAGNTVAMTDGAGSMTYVYDTWSRLLQETRIFSDIGSGTMPFPLSYTYSLGGQLTSITNPFGSTVGYVYDSAGQLTTVTGSGFGKISQFASGIQYRAWGAPKHINYGNNPRALDLTYTSRLQVGSSNLSLNGSMVMGYAYTYNPDSSVNYAQDLMDKHFDRAYLYDQANRITDAFSGNEARALTVLTSPNGPYYEHMRYDEWDNLLRRNARIWSVQPSVFSAHYVNDRNTNWTYDGDGNVVQQDAGITDSYDVAGDPVTVNEPNVVIGKTTGVTITQGFDASGQLVAQATNAPNTFGSHFVRSSVLGGRIVSEVDATGSENKTYIYQGNAEIAWHFPTVPIEWVHHSLTGSSYQTADKTGSLIQQVEFDQLGGRLPLTDPGPITLDVDRFDRIFPRVSNLTDLSGGCTVDFAPTSCDQAQRLLNLGWGALYNGPSVVWDPASNTPLFPSVSARGQVVLGSLNGSDGAFYDPTTGMATPANPAASVPRTPPTLGNYNGNPSHLSQWEEEDDPGDQPTKPPCSSLSLDNLTTFFKADFATPQQVKAYFKNQDVIQLGWDGKLAGREFRDWGFNPGLAVGIINAETSFGNGPKGLTDRNVRDPFSSSGSDFASSLINALKVIERIEGATFPDAKANPLQALENRKNDLRGWTGRKNAKPLPGQVYNLPKNAKEFQRWIDNVQAGFRDFAEFLGLCE